MNILALMRIPLIGVTTATLLALPGLPAAWAAEAPEAAVIEKFTGEWQGQGTLFGSAAKFEMRWEPALGGRFMRLMFANRMVGPEGERPVLQAEAMYRRLVDQLWEGTWFDSRGMVLPLRATATATDFTTYWGSSESELGRTVYRLAADGGLAVEDWVFRNGQWQQFGAAEYRRKSPGQD